MNMSAKFVGEIQSSQSELFDIRSRRKSIRCLTNCALRSVFFSNFEHQPFNTARHSLRGKIVWSKINNTRCSCLKHEKIIFISRISFEKQYLPVILYFYEIPSKFFAASRKKIQHTFAIEVNTRCDIAKKNGKRQTERERKRARDWAKVCKQFVIVTNQPLELRAKDNLPTIHNPIRYCNSYSKRSCIDHLEKQA